MGKLTRFARRVFRPVAMVGVVGIVSLSMIGAQPAYAADTLTKYRDAKAFEAIIKANYKTVAPAANVAMAAASFSPVGMGIRLAQLGFLAYSTSDIWMPWFSGTFGGGADSKPADPAQYRVLPGLTISNLRPNTSPSFTHQMLHAHTYKTTATTASTLAFYTKATCKHNTTGVVTTNTTMDVTSMSNGSTSTARGLNVCPTGQTVLGATVGPGATGAQYRGPENILYWGDLKEPSFDPYSADTKIKVRSECIGDNGVISTVEAESSGDYLRMPSCAAAGKGHGTGKTSIVGKAPGETLERPLWDSQRAPSDPATPLCDAMRPGSGCTLAVELDGKECQAGNVECENWQEVNESDPNKGTDNSRLKCKLGPYTLPLSQCGSLAKAFLPGGTTWAGIEPDGSPSPGGAPSTAPSGNPIAAPAPTTTAPGTVPGAAGAPAAGGSPADQQSAQCWPSGWGMLNPLEWVLKPLRCAFEPTKSVQTRVNTMSAAFSNKVPMSWFGVGIEGAAGGACPTNWAVTYKGTTHSLICGTPAEGIMREFRPVLGVMLTIAMVWPLLRSLFYAAIPVFKVNPS